MLDAAASSSPTFCPACGHNLEAERPLAIGPLAVDPRGAVEWAGRPIPLTCAQFLIVSAIAQAGGALVSNDVLAERSGYDGRGDANDVVQVLICRARHALRSVGAPPTLIRATRRRGYSLDVEMLRELATKGPRPC